LATRVPDAYTGAQGMATLGQDNPGAGHAYTVLWFTDGSVLRINWDGAHEVAELATAGPVIVYCPRGRRLHFPESVIEMIEHQERQETK
jgi:hypothetical protein